MKDLWKNLALIFAASFLTSVGWAFASSRHITREDASQLIKVESPYIKDKGVIQKCLADNVEAHKSIQKTITANTQANQELLIQLTKLTTVLENKN